MIRGSKNLKDPHVRAPEVGIMGQEHTRQSPRFLSMKPQLTGSKIGVPGKISVCWTELNDFQGGFAERTLKLRY